MSEAIIGMGSAVVVHSDFARRYVERHFDGPILRLGMPHDLKPWLASEDLSAWTQLVGHKRVFDVVSFGHIQPQKCIDLVIEAIGRSETLKRRLRFTIAGFIGDAVYYEELRSRVQALGLDDLVTFEVGVSEVRLAELMQSADMFVNLRQPNTEGASLSLVEQLDAGKPVIVFDSGCYAEIPDDAAVKLPFEAASEDIRSVILALIENPARLVEIGAAGRRYARTWTCASYARELAGFILAHRTLLERRGKVKFLTSKAGDRSLDDEGWLVNLARIRSSFIYLDRNILAVDPAVLLAMRNEELCDYVGEIIFGLFGSEEMRRALTQYFASLDKHAAYWACVRFAMIADAAFNDSEAACKRLVNIATCHDPDFWAVIELLPPRQFVVAATLILAKRPPTQEELTIAASDDDDNFPMRVRLARLLPPERGALEDQLGQLHRWAAQTKLPTTETSLPSLENVVLDAGSEDFRGGLELSGFHAIEPDRVWTRSGRAFFGMRLGGGSQVIEVQLYPIAATAQEPCEIVLAFDDVTSRVNVCDSNERWISIAINLERDRARRVQWFSLSTDHVSVPRHSLDPRILGLCVRKIKVKRSEELIDLEAQRLIAVQRLHDAALQMRSSLAVASENERRSTG